MHSDKEENEKRTTRHASDKKNEDYIADMMCKIRNLPLEKQKIIQKIIKLLKRMD